MFRQCKHDNIFVDVIDSVVNCTSVMRKCSLSIIVLTRGGCEYI